MRKIKVLGPGAVIVTSERDLQKRSSPFDKEGVFIQVKEGANLPDGYQALEYYMRQYNQPPKLICLLSEGSGPLQFDGRCLADKYISRNGLEDL